MTVTTAPDPIDWPWPEQIAAGHFQERLHRVRPGALAIQLDGLTYYAADCGAIAVPTTAPPETWEFCTSCWPCGLPVIPEPTRAPTPSAPVTLPDCLNWTATTGAYPARRARSAVVGASEVGWFESAK